MVFLLTTSSGSQWNLLKQLRQQASAELETMREQLEEARQQASATEAERDHVRAQVRSTQGSHASLLAEHNQLLAQHKRAEAQILLLEGEVDGLRGNEQRLLPGETVDMPVFFYVDPEFLKDRRMHKCNAMTLSYTFFRSSEWEEKSTDPREQQHLVTTAGEPSGVYWKAPAPEAAVTVTAEVTPAVAAVAAPQAPSHRPAAA